MNDRKYFDMQVKKLMVKQCSVDSNPQSAPS